MQVLLDEAQEAAGLGPLYDAVVIRGGHGHDLLRADAGSDAGEADRIGDRPGRDDRSLSAHQARDRGDGSQSAGVGERDVRSHELVWRERVRAGLLDELVVCGEEAVEAERAGAFDHGYHQRSRAVPLLHVDGQAEVDLAVVDAMRLAVDLGEVVGHHGHLSGGTHDRVGDQVGERDPLARLFEFAPARVEDRHGQGAEAGRGGDRARLLHVARERCCATSHRLRSRLGGGRGRTVGVRLGRAAGAVGGGGLEHVGLGDAPGGPAAGDPGELNPLDFGRARRDRRHLPGGSGAWARGRLSRRLLCAAVALGGSAGLRGDPRRGLGGSLLRAAVPLGGRAGLGLGGGRRSWLARLRGGWGALGGGAGAIQGDARDHLPDGHGLALADQDLNDRAAGWGGELDVDLVGRDLDDRVGSLDEVADLGVPFEDRSLAHRLPSSRRHNLDYLIGGGACGHL